MPTINFLSEVLRCVIIYNLERTLYQTVMHENKIFLGYPVFGHNKSKINWMKTEKFKCCLLWNCTV